MKGNIYITQIIPVNELNDLSDDDLRIHFGNICAYRYMVKEEIGYRKQDIEIKNRKWP